MNEVIENQNQTSSSSAHAPARSRQTRRGRPRQLTFWAAMATILGLPVNCVGMIVGLAALFNQLQGLRVVADRTEAQITRSRMRIVYPSDGGSVAATEQVRGSTPYQNKSHYLVVTTRGGDFLQDGPLKISPGGIWSGQARFGNAGLGDGDAFMIRIATTRAPLMPGTTTLPDDAIYSEPISVRRIRRE